MAFLIKLANILLTKHHPKLLEIKTIVIYHITKFSKQVQISITLHLFNVSI